MRTAKRILPVAMLISLVWLFSPAMWAGEEDKGKDNGTEEKSAVDVKVKPTEKPVDHKAVEGKEIKADGKFKRLKGKDGINHQRMSFSDAMAGVVPLKTTESGVRYRDLIVGEGAEAAEGMEITCHYTVWLADRDTGLRKGLRLRSSRDKKGEPITFEVGQGMVEGFSDGVIGMKEGGRRVLYVPWNLAWGEEGYANIPPETNVVFEVDFIEVK